MRKNTVTSLSIEPELLELAKRRVESIRPKTSFSAYIQRLIELDLHESEAEESAASKVLQSVSETVQRKNLKSPPKK